MWAGTRPRHDPQAGGDAISAANRVRPALASRRGRPTAWTQLPLPGRSLSTGAGLARAPARGGPVAATPPAGARGVSEAATRGVGVAVGAAESSGA